MRTRLIILVAVAALLIALSWYRQRSGSRKLHVQSCTDAAGLLYSEGAALRTSDGLMRCSGGRWVPYNERK